MLSGGGDPLVGNVLHKDKTLFQVVQERRLEVRGRTFHPLMQFLKNDVFDDFIGRLIV